MHKYFLGALLMFFVMFWAIMAFAEETPPQATFFAKPVLCTPLEKSMDMWAQIKRDDMKPLIGFRGNSFLEDGTKFNVDYFVMYDMKEQEIVVVERQDTGFQCLIAGGTGTVSFDPEVLRDLIGWNDIP